MCPLYVIVSQPFIQVFLQLLKRLIQLAPERNLIKFLQDGLMETFTDAICLGMTGFALGMLNTIDRKIPFLIVCFQLATVFRSPVCQHTDNAHFL